MDERAPVIVLVVKPDTSPRRSGRVLRWVRALLPTALLVVASTAQGASDSGADAITLDVDDVADAGPLSLAATLARAAR